MQPFVPKGIIPAMVTPITTEGRIHEGALRKLTNHLIDGGVHGLFPVGSQGEFFSLTLSGRHSLRSVCNTWIKEGRSSTHPKTA